MPPLHASAVSGLKCWRSTRYKEGSSKHTRALRSLRKEVKQLRKEVDERHAGRAAGSSGGVGGAPSGAAANQQQEKTGARGKKAKGSRKNAVGRT